VTLGPIFETGERNLFRTALPAGERSRALIDLTWFGQPLAPGRYTLVGRLYRHPGAFRAAPPVVIELQAPSPAEQAAAERLRTQGVAARQPDTGSWQPMLIRNWPPALLPSGLGPTASRQLALHLAVHRAAYGSHPLAEVPLEVLDDLRGPVLAPAAAVLRYELVAARAGGAVLAAQRAEILRQWPGLKRRLEQIDRGAGMLTTLRNAYGPGRNPR
jgi:hypothetical protein